MGKIGCFSDDVVSTFPDLFDDPTILFTYSLKGNVISNGDGAQTNVLVMRVVCRLPKNGAIVVYT